jgi:hypothetical protein
VPDNTLVVAKQSKEYGMEEIKDEKYGVTYDPATATVAFQGILRLQGYLSYQPIEKLLNEVIAERPPKVTLDVHGLEFISSSGIDVVYRFAYKVYSRAHSQLIVRRLAQGAPWQERLVRTIEMMAPDLQIELVEGEVSADEPTS